MKQLSEEELMHVANLARLELNTEEREKFAIDLPLILDDIEKIRAVLLSDETADIMISPSQNTNEYHIAEVPSAIGKEEALRNSKLSDGDYVVVPKVIHD